MLMFRHYADADADIFMPPLSLSLLPPPPY